MKTGSTGIENNKTLVFVHGLVMNLRYRVLLASLRGADPRLLIQHWWNQ